MLSTNNAGGYYDAARNSRTRQLYGNTYPLPESAMLPTFDRLAIIAYLRSAVRNDVRIAGLLFKIALGLGTPTPHINYAQNPAVNSALENYLIDRLDHILAHRGSLQNGLSAFTNMAYREWLICGEVFVVFQSNGKIAVVPSELVGSESEGDIKRADGMVERNGVIYDAQNEIVAYRIGRRVDNSILFDAEHSTVVPEKFCVCIGLADRVEEERVSTKFAPTVNTLHDIKNLAEAKLGQFVIQSSISYFITKNIAPEVYVPALESYKDYMGKSASEDDSEDAQDVESLAYDEVNMRSDYAEFKPYQVMYGEPGEDVKTIESKTNATDYVQTLTSYLDFVCACFGITTEEAFIGYRYSNYSSSRASKLSWSDAVEKYRELWTRLFDKIQIWIFKRGEILGDLPPEAAGVQFERQIDWVYPRIKEIDQTKAVQADAAEYAAGLDSRTGILARNGKYADEVDRQNVNDAVRLLLYVRKQAEATGLKEGDILAALKSDFAKLAGTSEQPAPDADNAEADTPQKTE